MPDRPARTGGLATGLAAAGLGGISLAVGWWTVERGAVSGPGAVDLAVAALVVAGASFVVALALAGLGRPLPPRWRAAPAALAVLAGVVTAVLLLTEGDWVRVQWWCVPARAGAIAGAAAGLALLARGLTAAPHRPGLRRAGIVAAGAVLGLAFALERCTFAGLYPAWHRLLLGLAAMAAHVLGWLVVRGWQRRGTRLAAAFALALPVPLLVALLGLWPGEDAARRDLVLRRAPLSRQLLPWIVPRSAAPQVDARHVGSLAATLGMRPRCDAGALDRRLPGRRDFNLVLLTIDTVRADFTGPGGAAGATPALTALAREAVVFADASSPNSASPLAFASLFTGRVPVAVADMVRERRAEAEGDPPLLAQVLAAAGRDTAAVTGFGRRFRETVIPWVMRGFARFRRDPRVAHPVADEVAEAALAELERLDPGRPWFLWAHWFDPHAPYAPPPRHRAGDEPRDRYRGEIAYSDEALGRVLAALRRRADWDRTVVVVTSDHGEEFREHGGSYHGHALYQEQVHVPLLVRVPGVAPGRVLRPVGLVDLHPTLLELLEVAAPPAHGRSLLPDLLPEIAPEGFDPARSLLLQCRSGPLGDGRIDALRHAEWKLIRNLNQGTVELYDLAADPAETRNLVATRPGRLRDLEARLAAWRRFVEGAEATPLWAERGPLDGAGVRRALEGADSAAREALLARLDAPDDRAAAVALVGAALPGLPAPAARLRGLALLTAYGGASAAPAVLRLLDDPAPAVRRAACSAVPDLLEGGDPEPLRQAAAAADPDVRRAALLARARLGALDAASLRAALGPARDAADALRTVLALAVAGDPGARARLRDLLALQELPPSVELEALRGLRRLPPEYGTAVWTERLSRELPLGLVAEELCRHLGRLDLAPGLPMARRLLGATRPLDRDRAEAWLAGHGVPRRAILELREVEAHFRELEALAGPLGGAAEAAAAVTRLAEDLAGRGLDDGGLRAAAFRWNLAAGGEGRSRARALAVAQAEAASTDAARALWRRRLALVDAAAAPRARLAVVPAPGPAVDREALRFDVRITLEADGGALPGGADPREPQLMVLVEGSRVAARPLPLEGILPGEEVTLAVCLSPGAATGTTVQVTAGIVIGQRPVAEPVSATLR